MHTERKGFTLIELLVVVLIIGILASIAIPQYFKVVEKARVAEAMSLIASVKSAEERYLARGGTYTNNTADLDISYPNMGTSDITTKFFKATISGAGSCSTGPCYVLSVQRQTTNGSVADRYGTYTLTCNVPNAPAVTSANGNVQNELLK